MTVLVLRGQGCSGRSRPAAPVEQAKPGVHRWKCTPGVGVFNASGWLPEADYCVGLARPELVVRIEGDLDDSTIIVLIIHLTTGIHIHP